MNKKILALALAILGSVTCARSQTVSPNFTMSGGTVTYTTGSVVVKGTVQTINSGTLTGFAASQLSATCTLANIYANTDTCEYIYYPGSGTSLLHSTSLETAMPYVLATVTTDASSNVTSVSVSPLGRVDSNFLTINPSSQLSFLNCKTTAACAQTAAQNHVLITGTISLSGGAATITNLPFANGNYRCWTEDSTTRTNPANVSGRTSTQMTINGVSSDTIDYLCVGRSL